jgi:hypothetical protein
MKHSNLPLHLTLLRDENLTCDFELSDALIGRGFEGAFLRL